MTRALEEIEKDLVAARQDHQDDVALHQLAVKVAGDLRAKAMAGDVSVTATALAEAENAATFSELPIAAKFRAIQQLEAEHLVAEAERYADGITATAAPLRADVERAFADAEEALATLVTAWRLDASYHHQVRVDVEVYGMARDVSPRVRMGVRGVVIDGREMRPAAVLEPVARLFEKTAERLLHGQPKAMS